MRGVTARTKAEGVFKRRILGDDFLEVQALCHAHGLSLHAARDLGEFRAQGAHYAVHEPRRGSVLFIANDLADLRAWLQPKEAADA